ncbi:phosphoglucosamine mutase [Inmirania thermothiophila]|uniref:Phosphoglucosamine mutase n=1 Tax=Inmirania thermothiophila TaxID=1750597 RepID=A0A3N1XZT5_9GAMM|nr:phosphoglucosamine mutase [Inmirania thermothiophila]ROR32089.1 phosphoglucosamine mutase [Inmirania thermothiophila]
MARRYFGTDGVRGRVGEEPVTAPFVLRLGWAAGRVLAQRGAHRVVIGKDTRISGYMFESALEAGLSAAGVDILLLGPMPTPGIAYLTRTLRAEAGIVISASHNPYHDNGIKFFSADGAKLPDAVEEAIEAELERPFVTVEGARLGRAQRVDDAAGRYIEFCKSTVPPRFSLKGMKLVVDCAHGATYHIAPAVFRELGAEVVPIGISPNGLNINDGCGSTAPQALREAVLREGADAGLAFDGDGDRVVMVDERGEIVDGDGLLYVIARARHACGELRGDVVGTQMTNLGLEQALAGLGIGLHRTRVGDRYILEALNARGWTLGGETSGHIICLDRTTTGDGIVSGLQVLEAMVREGRPLSALLAGLARYPQELVNVRVAGIVRELAPTPRLREAIRDTEGRLDGRGRVLLRPSGTEPVIRVMVEGEDAAEVRRLAEALAAVVAEELG